MENINKEIIKNLLKVNKDVYEECKKYENKLSILEKFDINDIILDFSNVPSDTSVEYVNKDGCEGYKDCFCRDGFYELIYEYCESNIGLNEIIEKLLNWNKVDI